MVPENDVLEKALAENFNHARHQETQRERYMSLYWLIWAAALAYIGRQGDFSTKLAENTPIFTFLLVMSLATLVLNLKWNAEFTNHMAAISAIAARLHLNRTTQKQAEPTNWPLPYPEFTGYMALPLKVPFLLNVGPWLSGIHCIGFMLSAGLLTYSLTKSALMSYIAFGLAAVLSIILCSQMYLHMKRAVTARAPSV